MGLRRLEQKGTHYYLHYSITTATDDHQQQQQQQQQQALEVVLLAKANSYTLKVTKESSGVQRWCVKLGRSAEEYLKHLCEAVDSEDGNSGVFEVQEEQLVWKQYFPDQQVYGKRGIFKLEKVQYDEALQLVLDGTMRDLRESSRQMQRYKKEALDNARGMEEAIDLAAKSVQMKEDLEKEIYGKCAVLINAKKQRIHQLRSTHPSSCAGRSSCLVRTGDEAGTSLQHAKRTKKQAKVEPQPEEAANPSDGYSSDTEVDEPEEEENMDTDEEKAISLSPVKKKRKGRGKAATARQSQGNGTEQGQAGKSCKADDSEELFNASLEGELYSSHSKIARPGITTTRSPTDTTSQPQSTPKPITHHTVQLVSQPPINESVSTPSVSLPRDVSDNDTHRSILYDLF